MIDYAAARLHMVDSQLRTNKVTDEGVLDAFLAVPRERFVPAPLHGIAYVDDDVPLGGGRFLTEPMVVARMLQEAAIGASDTVLEVGCAGGYGTALLARLARSVVGIDSDAGLVSEAQERLRALGIANAAVICCPMTEGYASRAPYDVIIFEGAVERIPEAIAEQLAEDGRLVAVVEESGAVGRAMLMTRTNGVVSRRPIFDAAVSPLPGFRREAGFVF